MKRRTFFRGLAVVLGLCVLASLESGARAQDGVARTGGILTAKGDAWIEVKADGEKQARRLVPRFIAALPPRQGGMDKVMLAKFQTLVVGNRVDLLWTQDQALRVVDIAMVAPRGRQGTVTGTVDDSGRGWIDVLPDDENEPLERYYPAWIDDDNGGSLDAAMLKTLSSLKTGDRVAVKWNYDERKRAIEVTKLAPDAKAADPKQEQ
jgi:hypothetical protein